MGPPRYVTPSTIRRKRRAIIQLEHLKRMLEDTPLIELEVKAWYELAGTYLALRDLLDESVRDVAWEECSRFKKAELSEEELSELALTFHCFEVFRECNWRKWARDTHYNAKSWQRLKSDPKRLEKHRKQNLESQRRRRAARKARHLAVFEEPIAAE